MIEASLLSYIAVSFSESSVYADVNKMYSNTDFDTNVNTTVGDPLDPGNFIPGLKSFINARRNSVEKQIEELNKQLSN